MGLYTIVVSIPGDYAGFTYADKVYHLNTRDIDAILKVAQFEGIDGICTSGTDVAVVSIGYVCEQMGLCGISYSAAKILTDKALMKKIFLDAGVSTAYGKSVSSLSQAYDVASSIGYPVVVKCPDSSGNRGIIITKDESQLKNSYSIAKETQPFLLVMLFHIAVTMNCLMNCLIRFS